MTDYGSKVEMDEDLQKILKEFLEEELEKMKHGGSKEWMRYHD